MRTLRIALAGLLAGLPAAVGLVALTVSPSHACSCAVGGTAQQLRWADAVFTGTLTDVEVPPAGEDGTISSMDPVSFRFDVDRAFEGDVPGEVEVTSARFGTSCGLEGMQVDTEYVVFATADGDLFESGLCSGTRPAARADLDRIEQLTTSPVEIALHAMLDLPGPTWTW